MEALMLWAGRHGVEPALALDAVARALARADEDYAAYRARSSRDATIHRLKAIARQVSDILDHVGNLDALNAIVGDASELDAALDAAISGQFTGHHICARNCLTADDRSWRGCAVALLDALERAVRYHSPTTKARRSRKLFAVIGLAFAFVELTGQRPNFSTDDDGLRTGPFADFVVAAQRTFRFADVGVFDRAIPDALRIASRHINNMSEVFEACPPRIGSPEFPV